jgi:hypothetical protein
MPSPPRKTATRKQSIGPAHVDYMLTGRSWALQLDARGRAWCEDTKAVQAAWESLRGELLSVWTKEHPNTRPWAWWTFEAPEPRRRVNGVHPFENPARERLVKRWKAEHHDIAEREAYRLHWGCPNCLMLPDDFDAEYEPEPEYLRRLKLLTDEETAALAV